MKKQNNALGVGVAIGGGAIAAGALAKSAGGFKALGQAFAGLFAHGGGAEVATLAPTATRVATEITAMAPTLRETPTLAPTALRLAVQVVAPIPGQEREQLARLAGDQRDRFLVMVAEQNIRALGARAYVTGAFHDWVADTAAALRRLGRAQDADLLDEARTLAPGATRWRTLDADLKAAMVSS